MVREMKILTDICGKADSYTHVKFPSKATEYMLVGFKGETNEITATKM
jgi:hypothetical protein